MSEPIEITGRQRQAYFTVRSLADYLSLSERTVKEWLKEGVLPSYKIHGARRIDPVDVDRLIAESRQEKAA